MEFIKKYKILIDLIILFIVVALVTIALKHYFKPILYMIIVTFLCNPIYKGLIKINIPRKVAGTFSILIINIAIILFIISLGSSIYNLLVSLYHSNVEFIENQIDKLIYIINEKSSYGIFEKIFSVINKFNITTSAMSTGDNIFAYFIGNIATFFLLIDKDKIYELILKIIPLEVASRIINQKSIFKKMIVVQMNLVLISTIEIIIGFFILKVPKALLLGIICGLLDFLPYVGTIIVFIPIIIYNIIVKDYFVAIGLIFLYILVQVVREFLEAKFLSNKLEIHPLLIILSVYIGMKIFGFMGMLVGPMYGILAKEMIYNKEG